MSVVIAGNITIDDIVLPDGVTHMGTIGGDVLYAAMGCRLWEDRVHMLTRVNQAFLDRHRETIEQAGLDTASMAICRDDTVRNWIIYDTGQRRWFLYRNDPELLRITSPDVDDAAGAPTPTGVFLAAMAVENQIRLARHYRRAGVPVLADPYDEDVSGRREQIDELLGAVDVFLPSAEEVHRYFDSEDYAGCARRFAQMGPAVVVIKLGKDGCLIYQKDGDRLTTLPAYDGQVVDLTGAGDAFGGGFAAGYLQTGDPVLAAAMGSVSSSFAIEGFGSLPLFEKTPQMAKERLALFNKEIQ